MSVCERVKQQQLDLEERCLCVEGEPRWDSEWRIEDEADLSELEEELDFFGGRTAMV
jgi:hypothetical protein